MVSKILTIKNKSGLHARPAGLFVKVVQGFKCDIILKAKDKEYNPKSLLGIMSAAIKCGEEIEITCNGVDENEALKAIEDAIDSKFGE